MRKTGGLGWVLLAMAAGLCGGAVAAQPLPPSPGWKAVDKKLDELGEELDFGEAPLPAALRDLETAHHVRFRIDKQALEQAGMDPAEQLVTRRFVMTPLRANLSRMLAPLELAFIVDNEGVLITTAEVAARRLFTRVYSVDELKGVEADILARAITTCVAPETWQANGGAGSVSVAEAARGNPLIVTQNYRVHQRVGDLLERLERIAHARFPPRFGPTSSGLPTMELWMECKLALPAKDLLFLDVPLDECVRELGLEYEMPLDLDRLQLKRDLGIDCGHVLINNDWLDLSLRGQLRMLFRDHLVVALNDGCGILVTSWHAAEERLMTKVYAIEEQLPLETDHDVDLETWGKLIAETIAPERWHEAGGPGRFAGLKVGGRRVLVVTQSYPVHEQIADLFARLRDAARVAGLQLDDGKETLWGPTPREQEIERILRRPWRRFRTANQPWRTIADEVRREFGLPVHLDAWTFEDVDGKRPEERDYSFETQGDPLREELCGMFSPAKAECVVDGGVARITAAEEAARSMLTRVYVVDADAKRRAAPAPGEDELEAVARWIRSNIAPAGWRTGSAVVPLSLGGADLMVVRQSYPIHREITRRLPQPTYPVDRRYSNPVCPDPPWESIEAYERQIGEPAIMLDGPRVRIYAPLRRKEEAKITAEYADWKYRGLHNIVGRHSRYRVLVAYLPAGATGKLHEVDLGTGAIRYDVAELRVTEKPWAFPEALDVLVADLARHFVDASGARFGWHALSRCLADRETRWADEKAIRQKVEKMRLEEIARAERYRQLDNTWPEDLPAEQCDDVYAYLLRLCEARYGGHRFWEDLFSEIRRERKRLEAAAAIADGDESRNRRHQITVECIERLMRRRDLDFKKQLDQLGVSPTTDVESLHPAKPGWNRKLH